MEWPERFDQRLHIFAQGETFDVNAFRATSTLRPDFVWRREAPLTNGVEFLLGDARSMPLPVQFEHAISYIKANDQALRNLANFPGVTSLILGLVFTATSARGARGAALEWNHELMHHALQIGISPVFYITYEFEQDNDQL